MKFNKRTLGLLALFAAGALIATIPRNSVNQEAATDSYSGLQNSELVIDTGQVPQHPDFSALAATYAIPVCDIIIVPESGIVANLMDGDTGVANAAPEEVMATPGKLADTV